jgi:hypothetical protein
MVCRAGILASCIDEGRRLELAGASAMRRASMSTGDAEGSGRWGSYQEVQGFEVRLVARLWRMMRSTAAKIVRRSSSCGRVVSVVVVLLKPASNQGPNLVSKVHEDKRRRTALVRKRGEAGAYRNRHRLPSVSARLGSRLRAAWWCSF